MPTQRKTAKSAKKSSAKSSRTQSRSGSQARSGARGKSASGKSASGKSSSAKRTSQGAQGSRSRSSQSRGSSSRGAKSSGGATRASRGRGKTPNALELLSEDHRNVQKNFRRAERMESGDPQLQELVQTTLMALTQHAEMEEELFYPALREHDQDAVEEAQVEHEVAKQLIAQLEGMDADDERYKATFKVLGEYVNHHVEEEEGQIFRLARRAKLDLAALGEEMMNRKQGGTAGQGGAEGAGEDQGDQASGGARGRKSAAQGGGAAKRSGGTKRSGGRGSRGGGESSGGPGGGSDESDLGDETSESGGYGMGGGDTGEETEQPGRSGRRASGIEDDSGDDAEIDVETPGGRNTRSAQ